MSETVKKTADPPKPAPPLARASETGDAAVHQLLAELQTARLNGDNEKVDTLVGALADLGYE